MKNSLVVFEFCVAMIATQVEMRTMNDRFRLSGQSPPSSINFFMGDGLTLNNYFAYTFDSQNGMVIRSKEQLEEGIDSAPSQLKGTKNMPNITISFWTNGTSSIPVQSQPTENEETTTTSSSISSSMSDSDAITTEMETTFPPSGIRSSPSTGSDLLVESEQPTEPADISTIFNDTSSTTTGPFQLPSRPELSETDRAATTIRTSDPSSDSTTAPQSDETNGVFNSFGMLEPSLTNPGQSMVDLKPEDIDIISKLPATSSAMDLGSFMNTSPSTETETETTSTFPASAPDSDNITSSILTATTTRSSDSPSTLSPTNPGTWWNQTQEARPDRGMFDARASPTSDQSLAACVPVGSATELVIATLTQALMPETCGGYFLPDEYQVLQVSRAVDNDITLHITLKLANGLCDVVDLRADGTSGKRRGTQFRPIWFVAGVRQEECPPEGQSTVPYCREGSF